MDLSSTLIAADEAPTRLSISRPNLLHTQLRTAPVHTEGLGLRKPTEEKQKCDLEVSKSDTLLSTTMLLDPVHENHKQDWCNPGRVQHAL